MPLLNINFAQTYKIDRNELQNLQTRLVQYKDQREAKNVKNQN